MSSVSRPAVAALLLAGLLLGGCGDGDPVAQPEPVTTGPADPPEAETACAPVEQPPLQAGSHLLGDQAPPVPYSSVPPTSGWHASGAFSIAVQPPGEPLTEPQQVSVLEVGGVVVVYHELDEEDRVALEHHVTRHHEGRVAVTPYGRLEPGEVAFTAWGVLQRCDGVDLEALDAFNAAHGDAEVGVPGEH